MATPPPIIVNASTTLVQVDTSAQLGPYIVRLSNLNLPGSMITVRDSTGNASATNSIVLSTISGITFLNGGGNDKNIYTINQRFGFLTVTPKTSSIWGIVNTFAFPAESQTANLFQVNVSSLNVSSIATIQKLLVSTTAISTICTNNLFVTGNIVYDQSTIGNVAFYTSTIYAKDDITTKTNLYVGSTLSTTFVNASSTIYAPFISTFNINMGGVLNTNSTISTAGPLFVGSSISTTGNLAVGASTFIHGQLLTGSISTLGSASIAGGLSVMSTIYAQGPIFTQSSITAISSISTLNNINAGGSLSTLGNAFIGKELYIRSSILATGSISSLENVNVAGAISTGSNVYVGGSLFVVGSMAINNINACTINVLNSFSTISSMATGGSFNVGGSTIMLGTVSALSNFNIGGLLSTTSSIVGGDSLFIAKNGFFGSTVSTASLGVSSMYANTAFISTLSTVGQAAFYSSLQVQGSASIFSSLAVACNVDVGRTLTTSNLVITGSTFISTLAVTNTFGFALNISSSTLHYGLFSTGGAMNIGGLISTTNALTVGSTIDTQYLKVRTGMSVFSNANFTQDIFVLSSLNVYGSTLMVGDVTASNMCTLGVANFGSSINILGSTTGTMALFDKSLITPLIFNSSIQTSSITASTIAAINTSTNSLAAISTITQTLYAPTIFNSSIQTSSITASTIAAINTSTNSLAAISTITQTLYARTIFNSSIQTSSIVGSTIAAINTSTNSLAAISTITQTLYAPTIFNSSIQTSSITASTIAAINTSTNSLAAISTITQTLYARTIFNSSIQTSSITASTIAAINTSTNSLAAISTITQTLFTPTIFNSSIQTSSITASTIAAINTSTNSLAAISTITQTLYAPTIYNSSIQTSSIVGSTIAAINTSTNSLAAISTITQTLFTPTIFNSSIQTSSILASTIITQILYTPIILNSTLNTSSIVASTIINQILYTPTIFNSTLNTSSITTSTIAAINTSTNSLTTISSLTQTAFATNIFNSSFQTSSITTSTIAAINTSTNSLTTISSLTQTAFATNIFNSTLQTSSIIASTIGVANLNVNQITSISSLTQTAHITNIFNSTLQTSSIITSTLRAINEITNQTTTVSSLTQTVFATNIYNSTLQTSSITASTIIAINMSTIGTAAFYSSVQIQGGLSVFSSIATTNINFSGGLYSNGVLFTGGSGSPIFSTLSTVGQAAFYSSVQIQGGLSVFSTLTAYTINFTSSITSNGLPFSGGTLSATSSFAQVALPLTSSRGICFDPSGNMYVNNTGTSVIYKITPQGQTSLFAGTPGLSGWADGTSALLNTGGGQVCYDAYTNCIAVADVTAVRLITLAGNVISMAGNASAGNAITPVSGAIFNRLTGVCSDGSGSLYVVDVNNNNIKKITLNSSTPTQYGCTVANVAGSLSAAAGYTNATGSSALFNVPFQIAINLAKTFLYVPELGNNVIRSISLPGNVVGTLAGALTSPTIGSTDSTTPTSVKFNFPIGITTDASGVYVADNGNNSIRYISVSPFYTHTLAGQIANTGNASGVGTNAQIYQAIGITIDPYGNPWMATTNGYIFNYSMKTGYLNLFYAPTQSLSIPGYIQNTSVSSIVVPGMATTTIFGSGFTSFNSGVSYISPQGLVMDSQNNLFVSDKFKVRKVAPSGFVTSVFGDPSNIQNTNQPFPGAAGEYNGSYQMCFDGGIMYIADAGLSVIHLVNTITGAVSNLAITGQALNNCVGILFNAGILYVSNTNILASPPAGYLVSINISTGVSTLIAGSTTLGALTNGTGTAARFNYIYGICFDVAKTNILICDRGNTAIRNYNIATAAVTTYSTGVAFPSFIAADTLGNYYATSGTILYKIVAGTANTFSTGFTYVLGVTVDSYNNIYVSDIVNNCIYFINPAGALSTYSGTAGTSGTQDSLYASSLTVLAPYVGINKSNAQYTLDVGGTINFTGGLFNNGVVISGGSISTFSSLTAYTIDFTSSITSNGLPFTSGVSATSGFAQVSLFIQSGRGICFDPSGNMYVNTSFSGSIYKITPQGVTSVLAGTYGLNGTNDGTGTAALFADSMQQMIYDSYTNCIVVTNKTALRFISLSGVVTSVATGFTYLGGVCSDGTGTYYVADIAHIIKKVVISSTTPAANSGVVTTIAGTGIAGYYNATGASATFNAPYHIVINSSKTVLYVADLGNHVIRQITLPGYVVTTFAGAIGSSGTPGNTVTATIGTTDSTTPGSVQFNGPLSLAIDASNNIYLGDYYNDRIRYISVSPFYTLTVAGNGGDSFVEGVGANSQIYVPHGITIYNGSIWAVSYVGPILNYNPLSGYLSIYYMPPSPMPTYIKNTAVSTIVTPGIATTTIFGSGFTAFNTVTYTSPSGLIMDSQNNLYVSDQYKIRKVESSGFVTSIYGDPSNTQNNPYAGRGAESQTSTMASMSFDTSGNMYFADTYNYVAYKLNLSTLTATQLPISNPTTGLANQGLCLWIPIGVLYHNNILYVSNRGNTGPYINAINLITNVITLIAGTPGAAGGNVDNAVGTSAKFSGQISGMCFDSTKSNIFVCDRANNKIRVVNLSGSYAVSTLTPGSGLITLAAPVYIAMDSNYNLFVAQQGAPIGVIKISYSGSYPTQTISYAASVIYSIAADGINYSGPNGITVDSYNNIYIADATQKAIYRIAATMVSASISTVGTKYSGILNTAGTQDSTYASSISLMAPYVGINMSNPQAALHVNGKASINALLSFANATSGNNFSDKFQIQINGGSQRLYIGAAYTSNAGAAGVIQASDFYNSVDNYNSLILNPRGGGVTIGSNSIVTVGSGGGGAGSKINFADGITIGNDVSTGYFNGSGISYGTGRYSYLKHNVGNTNGYLLADLGLLADSWNMTFNAYTSNGAWVVNNPAFGTSRFLMQGAQFVWLYGGNGVAPTTQAMILNTGGLTVNGNLSNTGTLGVAGTTTLTNSSNTGTLGVAGATTLTNTSNTGTLGVAGATTLANTSNTGTLGVAGYTTLASNITIGSGLGSTGQANTLVRLNQFVANTNWGYVCATDGLGDVSLAANCYTSNALWYPVNTAGSYSFISARQGAIKFWCGNNGSLPNNGTFPYVGTGATDTSLTATMSLNANGMKVTNTSNTGTLGVAGLTTLSSNLVLPLGTVGVGVVSAQSFTTEPNVVNLINNAPTNGMGQTTGFPGLATWTAANQQPLQISGYNGINFVGGRGNWTDGASHMCVVDGQVGIRTRNPLAYFEVSGGGGSGQTSNTMAFSSVGSGYRHFISTRHNSTDQGIYFYINNNAASTPNVSTQPGTGNFNSFTILSNSVLVNGSIGVGTTSPVCPLHVASFTSISFSSVGNNGALGFTGLFTPGNGNDNVSIKADEVVWTARHFVAASDERIKKNIIPVTDSLDIVNKLNIVSFDHIDCMIPSVKHGLIAQEVKQVYPQAISITRDYIPSVYNVGTYEKAENVIITSCIPHGFVTNDKIRIYVNQDGKLDTRDFQYDTEILEVLSDTQFLVKPWDNFELGKELFIYGKEINDFLGIDKPLIGLIAAGACKILSGQVSTLQSENIELRSTIAAILANYPV